MLIWSLDDSLASLEEELPDLVAVPRLIGKEPDIAEEFDIE